MTKKKVRSTEGFKKYAKSYWIYPGKMGSAFMMPGYLTGWHPRQGMKLNIWVCIKALLPLECKHSVVKGFSALESYISRQ